MAPMRGGCKIAIKIGVYRSLKIHNEAETQIQVGLPTKYLTRRERTQHGFAYTSSAGDIKIDTIRFLQHERSLDDLYDQLSKRGAIRKLGYTVKKSSEFVITGEDNEKRYYIRAIQLPDGIRAFAVAHKFDSPVDMGRIMVAMANSLRPGMPAAPAGAAVTPAKPRTEQRFSSGTGVVVTLSGHILTNAHVIEGCTQLAVRQIGDQSRSATIMAIDEKNDLALLRSTVSVPRLPKFRSGARLGETIAVFGFPLAGILAASGNFTLGNITASAGMGNDAGMLQISAPVQSGNSGGPLLDRSGHIVGIIVAKLKNEVAQNANFAIKAAIAQTFLEAHGVQVLTGDSQTALQPEDIAETAKDFTVLIVCQK